jgi:hypothetical protein
VDRRPHHRPLDDAPLHERTGQLIAFEPLEARPEPDVHRRGVLRLDPADPFQGAGERRLRALEQQLPPEQRPVQFPLRERARHFT